MASMDLYRSYDRTYVPFRLAPAGPDRARCSLGGAPPLGVVPPRLAPATRYFLTLGLEPGLDVSLFTSMDFTAGAGSLDPFPHEYRLLDESSPLVQFVVHPGEPRLAEGSPLACPFPPLAFVLGPPGLDPPLDEAAWLDGTAEEGDKIGGLPTFDQLEGDVAETLALLREGWVHLVQLHMPTAPFVGSWYFGEATFHVFARKAGVAWRFRCIWG